MQLKPRRAYKTKDGKTIVVVDNRNEDGSINIEYPFKNLKSSETYMSDGRFIVHDTEFKHPHSLIEEVEIPAYTEITCNERIYWALEIEPGSPEFIEVKRYGQSDK